ncbi:hypothetical protein [Methylococcus capsulatus]|nr:hypothetical protein [Methylococcus capsulatus]
MAEDLRTRVQFPPPPPDTQPENILRLFCARLQATAGAVSSFGLLTDHPRKRRLPVRFGGISLSILYRALDSQEADPRKIKGSNRSGWSWALGGLQDCKREIIATHTNAISDVPVGGCANHKRCPKWRLPYVGSSEALHSQLGNITGLPLTRVHPMRSSMPCGFLFALVAAVAALTPSETSHAAPIMKVAARPNPHSPKVIDFPPHRLDELRSEWHKALSNATANAPPGSPERPAWILSAWWAIVDWCTDQGDPCEQGAAKYVKKVFGLDPRSIDDCGWAGAIGGTLGDGYDATSGILYGEQRAPVLLPDLFEKHEVKRCRQ